MLFQPQVYSNFCSDFPAMDSHFWFLDRPLEKQWILSSSWSPWAQNVPIQIKGKFWFSVCFFSENLKIKQRNCKAISKIFSPKRSISRPSVAKQFVISRAGWEFPSFAGKSGQRKCLNLSRSRPQALNGPRSPQWEGFGAWPLSQDKNYTLIGGYKIFCMLFSWSSSQKGRVGIEGNVFDWVKQDGTFVIKE